ncbi:MAG: hypothetical protein HAW63_01495 [Bdellovibrionaceae bacterium]|nr:hypothetical protein [Pseudobdellovibrionaceae bacterium]
MFKKNLFAVFVFATVNVALVNQSFAGWFIEPYLGYEAGLAILTPIPTGPIDSSSGLLDNRIDGMFFGARVGYNFLNFVGGLEHSLSKSQWKKEAISPQDSFVFAGLGLPGIRLLAAFGLSHKFQFKTIPFSGKSYKLSLAFTGTPFININIEYLWRKFNKRNSVTVSSANNSHKMLRMNISLPLP